MQHFRLTTLLAMLALALALPPAAAAQSLDDAWVKAQKSCAALDAFKRKYPAPNRFSGQYAATARKLGCTPPPPKRATPPADRPRPAPTTRPKPRPPVVRERVIPPPQPYRAAPSVVTLAPSGGDARDLDTALAMVAYGGTIKVRPGRYWVRQNITKPVRIEGGSGAYSSTIFEGRITIANGVSLTASNITLRGTESGNVVNTSGVFSCYSCVIESNYGGWEAGSSIIQVAYGGRLALESTVVQMNQDCTGSCSNIWFTPSAAAGSTLTSCYLSFSSHGIYVQGGSVYISKTNFVASFGAAIRQTSGSLTVSDSIFSVTKGSRFFVIQTDDSRNFQMSGSRFTGITKAQVLHANGSPVDDVTRYPTGNYMF